MPDTTTPGPYAITEPDIAVPPEVEQKSAELYRQAYAAGWRRFAYAVLETGSQEEKDVAAEKLSVAPDEKAILKGGYDAHVETFKQIFLDGFYEGWAASSAAYIRDKRKKV